MDRRLQPIRRKTFVVLAVGLVGCGPWLGWWTIAPLLSAVAVFWVAEQLSARSAHPEFAIFGAWAVSQGIIAASVALTGSLREVTVCWLAIPIMTLSARFSVRGIVAGVGLTVALMAAVLLSAEPSAVVRQPPILFAPVLLVVASAMLSTALMRSDIEHRGEALIDALTGMLNRNALARRTEELRQQSEISGDPVGVIVADIDHFKRVNDSLGHAAGDAVLKDVAYTLRKHFRAFESAYRLGGEEFLILLPGADLPQAFEQAERLRQAIAAQSVGDGQRVTISLGVAASRRSSAFDYTAVMSEADAALYDAKGAGRNRVCACSRQAPRAASKVRLTGSVDPAPAQ